jgi:rare lipoprotein A
MPWHRWMDSKLERRATGWPRAVAVCVCLAAFGAAGVASADDAPKGRATAGAEARSLAQQPPVAPGRSTVIRRDGRKQKGKASFYSRDFAGKKMANGKPFHTNSNSAASKTLPLGTTAKVTNLDNGRSQSKTAVPMSAIESWT